MISDSKKYSFSTRCFRQDKEGALVYVYRNMGLSLLDELRKSNVTNNPFVLQVREEITPEYAPIGERPYDTVTIHVEVTPVQHRTVVFEHFEERIKRNGTFLEKLKWLFSK